MTPRTSISLPVAAHVARPIAATERALVALLGRLEMRARSVRLYQRLTDGAGVLAGLRALGARITARFHKARSMTQTPSAIERAGEELAAAKLAGVPDHQLRLVPVHFTHLIDDMDAAPATEAQVLGAIAVAREAEAVEDRAEARLTLRADRMLGEADLERLIEAKSAEVAADQQAIALASKLRRQLRRSRQAGPRPFVTVRGGGAA